MNTRDRQNIIKNIDLLSDLIDLKPNLLNQMINKNIFTQRMIDDIMKIEDQMDRKKRFLFDLTRRGPEAYDTFVEVLYGADQIPAAQVLRPDSFQPGLRKEQVIENIVHSSQPDPTSTGIATGMDSGDYSRNGHSVASIENEDFMINVQNCKKEMKGDNIYRMASRPRGFCLIFNYFEFVNNSWDKRMGSETESNRLRDVFNQLYFSVEVKNNLTKKQMIQTLSDVSKLPHLKRHDAFILIVLSHGRSGHFITADGLAMQFEDIVTMFNNENCPHLISRPKLFFFNCCRGDSHDSGPKFQFGEPDMNAVTDAKTFNVPKIPIANDIMICYSTVDGYVSWRNEENGSWFGTALSQSLMRHSHDKELHHILTIASNLVNNKVTQNGEKQVMEHMYRGWNNLFYFNPGIGQKHSTSSSV